MGTSVPFRPSSCSCSWGHQLCRTDTSCLFFVPMFKSASFPLSGPLASSNTAGELHRPPRSGLGHPHPPLTHSSLTLMQVSKGPQDSPRPLQHLPQRQPVPCLICCLSSLNLTMGPCATPQHTMGCFPSLLMLRPLSASPGSLPHHPSLSHPRHWAQPPLAMLLCLCPCPAPRWRHQSTH